MGDSNALAELPPIRTTRLQAHHGSNNRDDTAASQGSTAAASQPQNSNAGLPPMYPVIHPHQQQPGVTAQVRLLNGIGSVPMLYGSPKAASHAVQRHGFQISTVGTPPTLPSSSSGGANGPSVHTSMTGGKHRISYGTRTPTRKVASWFAIMVLLGYLSAMVYYLYVRIAFTLDMKDKWYSISVLVVECIGMTAVVPYAFINAVHTNPTGSPGLPADDSMTEPDKKFTVRVLVPCYKESLGVVSGTLRAALEAELPPGVTRAVYLCDDGKDPDKKNWLDHNYGDGHKGEVHYITGRSRAKEEINGKSANLNNVLKNHIYKDHLQNPSQIPLEEIIIVFDADMQAKPNFFLKLLEVMVDDKIALCLSPQSFNNVNPSTDIYNNTNEQFWQYILPGLDAMGYIACTGTNFCLRARALGSVGWFPEFCITEDYALSIELKAAGYKGKYLAEYLAVGEAPTDELRNVLRQRSRWTKGHMQIFFSGRNPLLRWKLPFVHKLLYSNGTWSYFCTIITTWTFLLVPFISLMFEIQPVKFGREFALAALLYLFANFLVMNYFHVAEHMRGIWMANVSNYLLTFTYAKAIVNTLLAKVHIKKKAGFKPTEKSTGGPTGPTAQLQLALMNRLTSLTKKFNQATLPHLYQPQPIPTGPQKKEDECIPDKIFMFLCLSLCINTLVLGLHQVFVFKALRAWLALPMLWAIYNAVPPILFFGSLFASTDNLHNMCFWLQWISMGSGLGAVLCLWFVVPVVY